MAKELSEEDVFANDIDPLDAIREIRREEGVAEEDLIISDSDTASQEVPAEEEEGSDELDNLTTAEDDNEPDTEGDSPGSKMEQLEQDADNEEDEGEDESEEEVKTPAPVATDKRKFTANGQEFEFSQEEILNQFETVFGKAMDYTGKMQKIAPYRKMISALETENISAAQLNVAIDALKGNKQALRTLMEANNVDAYDVTNDDDEDKNSSYIPTEYGKNETELGIEEVANKISRDPEYKITVDVIDRQWDSNSRQAFASNPAMIQGLHNDIRSGMYDKVAPVAMKMKVLDGNTKSDIEYYMLAGEQVLSAEKQTSEKAEKTVAGMNQKAQDAEGEFDQASSEAQRKRSATSTRKRADRKGVIDYLDDNDEEYEAWYKRIMA